eukprot:TRINITY_DN13_c0_g1_i1.p2 TRINITY_DN13_c0_g1~~TRINITY_DN13_c0_g1_i1.p2  ORF type:complete len:431 (+),score=-33.20 TRINITY_DN13_c0_g1_i1:2075-3367(+)
MAKSAQILLHPWLPDAMEGPTPVSSLLHSATMVTAGIFLIMRSSVIFSFSPTISFYVAVIGLITALFSSFTGLLQYDIKRIIAFSTCSQLGFMMFSTGLGNYNFALFHLVNHAFFKALLFLSAGSVIHATHHQDIRKMGGLRKLLPITYICFMIGSLSLIGFPFFSGFYSKDFLLESSWGQYFPHSFPIYLIASISAFLTSFYSFRLIYFVFFGGVNLEKNKIKAVAESDIFLLIPLFVLSLLSIFSGFFLRPLFLTSSTFWRNSLYFSPLTNHNLDFEFSSLLPKLLPTIFSISGLIAVYLFYGVFLRRANEFYKSNRLLVNFFSRKFFFDSVYNYFVALPVVNYSLQFSYKILDKGFFEHFGPFGLYKITNKLSIILEKYSSSFIYHNLLFVSLFFIYAILFVFLSNFFVLLLFMMIPFFDLIGNNDN